MITIDAIGLDAATAQVEYLRAAAMAYSGCYYRGSSRSDAGGSNAAVMEKLAHPDNPAQPPRNLKTLSDENAAVISDAWKAEVEKQLNHMAENAAEGGKAALLSAKAVARQASGAGFKAAGRVIMRMLAQRIASNLHADASGNLSPAAKVSPGYAAKREAQFGVGRDEVYKASGQLMADMDDSNQGQIVLVPGSFGQ